MGCTVTLLPSSPLSFFLFIPPGSLRFLESGLPESHRESIAFLILSLFHLETNLFVFLLPISVLLLPISVLLRIILLLWKGPQTSSDFLSILKNSFDSYYETLCEELLCGMFISDCVCFFSFFSFLSISCKYRNYLSKFWLTKLMFCCIRMFVVVFGNCQNQEITKCS